MDNLFRVISSAELASATKSGLVPRCPSDERSNCVHLNHRKDVETVANLYFTPDEAPVALEIRRSDIDEALAFAPATQAKPFGQVTLARPNILLAWVVEVHTLHVQSRSVPTFKFVAAPNNSFKSNPLRGSA